MSLLTKRIFTSRRFYKNILPIALGSYFITKLSKKLLHKMRRVTSTPNFLSKEQKKIDFRRIRLSSNVMDKLIANRWKELMKTKEEWRKHPDLMNTDNFRIKLSKDAQRLRSLADKRSPKVSPRPLHTDYLVLTTTAPSSPLLNRPPSPLPLRPHSPVQTKTPLLENRPLSPLPLRSHFSIDTKTPLLAKPTPLRSNFKNSSLNRDIPL